MEAAIQFVQNHGNKIERARLLVLLRDDTRTREAVEQMRAGQRKDGSWAPFWAPDASSVDATCYRLAQCEQLGLGREAFVDQALSYILSRQKPDGSWEEDESLATVAPPWAMPGDRSATIYLTANAGYWLRFYLHEVSSLPAIQAYLKGQLTDTGHLPTFLHANWLAAGFLHSLGDHEKAESIMLWLQTQLPEMDASNLAWLINALCVMGVSPKHLLIRAAQAMLEPLQMEDGHWASEDGEWQDVHTTLEALRALTQFG